MTTNTRAALLVVGACIAMTVLSALAMTEQSFSLVSPYPMLLTVAWIVLVGGNTMNADLSRIAAALIIPLLFVLWSLPLLRGATVIPSRSRWAAAAISALSCAYFAFATKYGLMFQGSVHTLGVIAVNILFCTALLVVYVFNRRYATFATNLIFHAVLFTWLGTYAFPFLGEGS